MTGTFTQQAIGWGPGARSGSPVTPNFGQQPPESGNLLICLVFAGGSTKTAWNCTLATGSGWTQRLSIANDPANTQSMCGVAVFTKITDGTDTQAGQSFNIPSGWTGQASVHEVFGSSGEIPDITGTWAGGNTAIARTSAAVSVSSTGNPSDPNELIISVYGFWCGSTGTASYSKSSNMTQICDRDDTMNQQYHWVSSHLTPNTFPGGQAPTTSPFTDTSTVTVPGSSVACGLIIGWTSASNPQPPSPSGNGQIYPATYPGGVTRTSGQGTLAVSILNIGSLLAVASKVSNTTVNLSGITDTAGITAGWTKVSGAFIDSGGQTQDLWIGYSTGTGNTTLNFTFGGTIGSTANDALFAEFYAGAPGTWSRDGSQQATANNTSSGTWTWPSLTAARVGEIYLGRARGPAGGPFRNFSPNGVNVTQDGNNNPFLYWPGLASGAISGPAIPSLNSTVSYVMGALLQQALTWSISGTSATVTSTSATMGNVAAISGTSATPTQASGAVVKICGISGSCITPTVANGTLASGYGLSGTSVTASHANGTVFSTLSISGTSITVTHGDATLTGVSTYAISGTSITTSVGTAAISVISTWQISGTSITPTLGSGAVGLVGLISGSSSTVSVCDGWLLGALPLQVNGWCQANLQVQANAWLLAPVYTPPPSGSQDYVWVEILDNNLVSQGPIQFVTLTAQLYYNAVGSWSMIVPYSDALWSQMMSGDFMVNVNWRGLFTFGGKCEQPGYTDSIPGTTGGGGAAGSYSGPFITLAGADYLALLANKICYPAPGSAWGSQTASATDAVSSMNLETAIKHYINNNIGPGALAARRHSLLDIATDQARGPSVSYTVKFGTGVDLNLMDVIRALIASGGSAMGVSITRNQPAHRLTADVYIPRDLSGKAWFSRQLGNLTAINFSLTDPTVTDALVQGSGTNFVSRVASGKTQWNATELFNDSSSETDTNNLAATAQGMILGGAAGPTISATAADTPFLTFGRDYGLGDIVTMEVRPGNFYSDVITGVTLTADPSATPMFSVVPTVGQSANATATDNTIIGQLTKRIQALEKKLATK